MNAISNAMVSAYLVHQMLLPSIMPLIHYDIVHINELRKLYGKVRFNRYNPSASLRKQNIDIAHVNIDLSFLGSMLI